MHVVFLLFSYLSSPCTTSTDVYVVYIHRVKCFRLLRKLSKISTLLVKSFLFFCKWKLHGFPFCPFVEWIEDVYFFTCFTAFLVWASKIEFLQLQPSFKKRIYSRRRRSSQFLHRLSTLVSFPLESKTRKMGPYFISKISQQKKEILHHTALLCVRFRNVIQP